MVVIGGKFQLIRNENFYEHLVALGIVEERAREANEIRPIFEITINGKEVTFASVWGEQSSISTLILNEEVDETVVLDLAIKSTVSIEENSKIKIVSVGPKGEIGIRLFEFFDTKMTMTLWNETLDIPVAKRFYRRL